MGLRKIRNIAFIAAVAVLFAAGGYDFGRRKVVSVTRQRPYIRIKNAQPPPSYRQADFALFWEVWRRLEKDYIDKQDLIPQKMVWGAIKGMVAAVDDPYTVFLPPKENQRAKEDLAGSFEGIGAQLGMKNKRIVVVAPLKGMPAEKAGLKSGDYIVQVDGKDTSGWTLPEAVNNIRGLKGTKVVLAIVREGEPGMKDIPIIRGKINVPSIATELGSATCAESVAPLPSRQARVGAEKQQQAHMDCRVVPVAACKSCPRIAVLRLFRFGDRTNGEWKQAVEKIVEYQQQSVAEGKDFAGVIFDLRNNPGGYLQGAVYVAAEFLDAGIIVKQRMKNGTTENYGVERIGRLTKVPLIVLVNKGSASASEIVAGALRDHQRAIIVGTKTFGKGSVQEAQELPGGAGLHITTAKWLLPSGKSIDKNGIKPSVVIEENQQDPTIDAQLAKAIELLLNKE